VRFAREGAQGDRQRVDAEVTRQQIFFKCGSSQLNNIDVEALGRIGQ